MCSKLRLEGNPLNILKMSILIIGPQKYFRPLGRDLKLKAEAKFRVPVEVSSAELVTDVTNKISYSLFDSIVIAVDTTKETFSTEFMATLMGISSDFLVSRTFLINASCGSCSFESALNFKQIANKFNINYINSDIENKESCCYLVERLTDLIDVVTGMSRGKPLLLPTASVLSNVDQVNT